MDKSELNLPIGAPDVIVDPFPPGWITGAVADVTPTACLGDSVNDPRSADGIHERRLAATN